MACTDVMLRRQHPCGATRHGVAEPNVFTLQSKSKIAPKHNSSAIKQAPGPADHRCRSVIASCSKPDGSEPSISKSDAFYQGGDYVHWPETSAGPSSQGWSRAQLPSQSLGSSDPADDGWEFAADKIYIPAPSNLPTHEDGSFYTARHATHRRDFWTLTDQPGIDMFLAGPLAWGALSHVFVILFGVGERDTEGIYSLRAFGDEGVPVETIIAFESEDDAQRYAALLEASMDHVPNVCSIPPRELLNFCMDQGYSCRLEPDGTLLIPPDYNVGVTDWERSLRLREGKYTVLEEEPDSAFASLTAQKQATAQLENLQGKPGTNSSTLARYTGFSEAELQAIKAKLETLLPKD